LLLDESAIWSDEQPDPANPPSTDDLLAKKASIEWFKQARAEPWFAELDALPTLELAPVWYDDLADGYAPSPSVLTPTNLLSKLNIARIRTASPADAAQLPLALRSNFALADAVDRYGLVITQLIANAIRFHNVDAVLDSLTQPWPDATLAQMQSAYEASPPRPFSHIIASEGLWMKAGVASHFSDVARVKRGMHDPSITNDDVTAIIRTLWYQPDDHAATQRLGTYVENKQALGVMLEDVVTQSNMTVSQRLALNDTTSAQEKQLVLISPLRPAITFALEQAGAAAALHTLTITALALERHHRAHGTYPDDLAALVPTFLASIPIDPIANAPLRYRADSALATYTLWSIGPNAIDDGGVTAANYSPRSAASVPNHDIVVHSPKR
jgi:hypothetical protein